MSSLSPARLRMAAQVFSTRPWESRIDWLKLKPLRMAALVYFDALLPLGDAALQRRSSDRPALGGAGRGGDLSPKPQPKSLQQPNTQKPSAGAEGLLPG
jgi:hypothetical protein